MAKMVKITINEREIEAPEGANVLQVAKDNGIHIAHYCYCEGLPIAGVCRLCAVKVNDNPRTTISCNLTVQDGMKIDSESPDVKEVVRWNLQLHLANHPIDCPICDQAGECILQESYMEYGAYDSNMTEEKVHKPKVVDLGPTIVLDKERCILCTRCTRFTEDVTKTFDLGIFNRGDRSEIGTYHDEPFINNYSLNTVDICPVGALTSKDFRFKQRVWFTKKSESICIKCSTGCNTIVSYNHKAAYRVQPRKNMDVNTWWMCDEGRNAYKWLNTANRYTQSLERSANGNAAWLPVKPQDTLNALTKWFQSRHTSKIAWIISPQHTVEEYEALFALLKSWHVQDASIFYWFDEPEKINDFDDLLLRGDKSPNTKGLKQVAEKTGFKFDVNRFKNTFKPDTFESFVFFAPENFEAHPRLETVLNSLPELSAVWLGAPKLPNPNWETCLNFIIPTKTFAEKEGTYINHAGLAQKVKPFLAPNMHVQNIIQLCQSLASYETPSDHVEKKQAVRR